MDRSYQRQPVSFLRLPDEVLAYIVSYLPLIQLADTRLVSEKGVIGCRLSSLSRERSLPAAYDRSYAFFLHD